MKAILLSILSIVFIYQLSQAQCVSIALTDSSFEEGTFDSQLPGGWFRDDGCDVYGHSFFHGDSSSCSNNGGGIQNINVLPYTTYYLSCYILNGASDYGPYLRARGNFIPVNPTTNSWTLISISFDSGTDTVVEIGFYSSTACFDLFRVTCSPVTDIGYFKEKSSFQVLPTSSNNQFTFTFPGKGKLEVIDINGRIIESQQLKEQIQLGENWPAGIYFVRFQSDQQFYTQKIVKL